MSCIDFVVDNDKVDNDNTLVSHLGETEHKKLLLINEVNAFSNRGYFYGYFWRKIQISQKLWNGKEISKFIRKPLFWDTSV